MGIVDSVKELLVSGQYSDLTIVSGSEYTAFKVHRNIVCSQSKVFEKALEFPTSKERKDHEIDLSDDETYVVKLLLDYLYTGSYQLPRTSAELQKQFDHTCTIEDRVVRLCYTCKHYDCDNACGSNYNEPNGESSVAKESGTSSLSSNALLVHAKMYAVADKYDIADLKNTAKKCFEKCANVSQSDFFEAVDYAFSSTPESDRGLRDIVSWVITAQLGRLWKGSQMKPLLERNPGLACDILETMAKSHHWI